jgi:hypothetical protein
MEPDDLPPPHPDPPDLPDPRCGHYSLAHHALRGVAFQDPLFFLGVLASPDAQRFLADLLRRVQEHCKDREPLAEFSVEELTVHKRRVGKYPCAVIELPPPRAVAEAYFVAGVLLSDPAADLPQAEAAKLRYFTLEKGMSFDGSRRTVLCEWTKEGTHRNFGDGPPPIPDGFLAAIEKLVSK